MRSHMGFFYRGEVYSRDPDSGHLVTRTAHVGGERKILTGDALANTRRDGDVMYFGRLDSRGVVVVDTSLPPRSRR